MTRFIARHKKVNEMLKQAKHVNIGLPYDGAGFNDATAEEAMNRLIMLKEAGYNVPQYAIDALKDET